MLHTVTMTTSNTEEQWLLHGTRIQEYLLANSSLYPEEPVEMREGSSLSTSTVIHSSHSFSGHSICWQSEPHLCCGTDFRISGTNAERQASHTILLLSKKRPILLLHYPRKERSKANLEMQDFVKPVYFYTLDRAQV